MRATNRLDAERQLYADIATNGASHLRMLAKVYPNSPAAYRAFAAAMYLRATGGIQPSDLVPSDVARLVNSQFVRAFVRSYVLRLGEIGTETEMARNETIAATVMGRVLRQMRPAVRRVLGAWPPDEPPRESADVLPDYSPEGEARRRRVIERAIRASDRYARLLDHLKAKKSHGTERQWPRPDEVH